jgi:hypothetical protein
MAGDYRVAAFRLERRRPAPVVRTVAFERRRWKSSGISTGFTGHLSVPKTLNPAIVVVKSAQNGARTNDTGALY